MNAALMRLQMRLALLLLLALSSAHAQSAAPGVPVRGTLLSKNTGAPVPGLMASLIHPVLGRSAPSYSDREGHFGWLAIPARREAYYLEVYWGSKLLYRQPVQITAPVTLAPLRL